MRFASNIKPKLTDAVTLDQASINELAAKLPAVNLTSEQLSEIASQIPGGLTINQIKADLDLADAIGKKHSVHSDDQDLANYILDSDSRLTDSRVPKTHTHQNDHAPHSDDQDLSTKVDKITGKGLSTNDYTTAEQTKLAGLSNYIAPGFNSVYRTLLDSTGSHIAAKAAGTYGIPQGNPLAVTGTGTLYSLNTIYIAAADYPTIDGKASKLRVRAIIECNDVAPFTGTFKIGLHPVTRPATSGGAGLCIYTIGSPVTGSQVTGTNLAADSQNQLVGADFDLPADGFYVMAVVTSATMATSSHVHISASLQIHNA